MSQLYDLTDLTHSFINKSDEQMRRKNFIYYIDFKHEYSYDIVFNSLFYLLVISYYSFSNILSVYTI